MKRAPDGKQLWGKDGWESLAGLAGNPALLKWSGSATVEPDGILESVEAIGVEVQSFYRLLRWEFRALSKYFAYGEFAYDWRQDIRDTAKQLGQWLSADHGFVFGEQGLQVPEDKQRLILVGHSMGALVAAMALLQGDIHPANVQAFIAIGAPFGGAPSAFGALYDLGYLPGMVWIEKWVNRGRDKRHRTAVLLDTIQSFTSAYQLLPPEAHPFVSIDGDGDINPLGSGIVPEAASRAATEIHALLARLEEYLQQHSVPYHFIVGSDPQSKFQKLMAFIAEAFGHRASGDTPERYWSSIGSNAMGKPTYEGIRVQAYGTGDHTVPVRSATLNRPLAPSRLHVVGVAHDSMCDNRRVVDLAKGLCVMAAAPRR